MSQERLSKVLDVTIASVACLMVLYHMVSTQYLIWGTYEHQATHLGFALILVFLSTWRSMKRRKLWLVAVLPLVSGLVALGYIFFNFDALMGNIGFIRSPMEAIAGILLVIAVFEATRQAWGLALPSVTAILLFYFFFGYLAPGVLRTSHFQPVYVLDQLATGFSGIFGDCLRVSANFIFLFVVFGGLMGAIGAHKFFIQIGRIMGRVLAGGAAQTAVVASALLGMVMGQAVSNVVLTGAFTIPLMKKMGYRPEQAGAVEAAASSGGQFTPPIMGESAFLMSTLIGLPYINIALAAFIPAALYFLSVALGVQVIAYRDNIPRPREKVETKELLLRGPLFIIPLGVVFVLLLLRFSPMYSIFYTILIAMIVPLFRKETRVSPGDYVRGITEGAVIGAKIGVSLALIGMLVQAVTTTGLGVKIAYVVDLLSGGRLWLTLIITMFLSLFLGIGVPTLAAYAIVAIIVTPSLVNMGVTPLAAHFFAFWFAIFSALTPPVAFASMAGAALAGANFLKTSWEAFRLAMAGFILPYLIIYSPVLILQPESTLLGILQLIAIPVGLAALVVALYGCFFVHTPPLERLLFALAAVGLFGFCFTDFYILFAIGLPLFGMLTFSQWRKKQRKQMEIAQVSPAT